MLQAIAWMRNKVRGSALSVIRFCMLQQLLTLLLNVLIYTLCALNMWYKSAFTVCFNAVSNLLGTKNSEENLRYLHFFICSIYRDSGVSNFYK